MKYQRFILLLILILSASLLANAQTKTKVLNKTVKLSPAYAEVLYRQVSVRSELEDLLFAYTDEYPKVRELRIEEDYLKQEMKRLLEVELDDASKLSPALGKLIVEKVSLEIGLWKLLQKYNEDHPEVKRSKRKIQVYENAIKDVL